MAEWLPIGKKAAHSAYEINSWYKYLIDSLVFSRLCFWSGNLFLIAPFPDRCLIVCKNRNRSALVRELLSNISLFVSQLYAVRS